ncbi:tRNA-dihydrouridine synthase [Patescibacteria group bacterium]|nr:tRNA-dihydrouridine synthase [Patescibacteria group bacterium]
MKGFWKKISEKAKKEKRPITASASMSNVTDAAFRRMIAKHGKPDVIWTEFVSCDGLCSRGRDKLMQDLIFDKAEHPIVVQFFGSKPENFYKCALLAQELGFDGIDINMGCPDRAILKQGAGASLIKNPRLARRIIKETIRGAGKLPVSVKTRIGFNEIEIKKWLPQLLNVGLSAITIHGRTKKEMSKVLTHWDVIAEAVKIRDKKQAKNRVLILGNGDIESLSEAQEKYEKYGVDGIMVGRGLFGNPWFFNSKTKGITLKRKLKAVLEHTKLFEKIFGDNKHFDVIKKHYKSYVSGFDDAKKIRIKLMTVKNIIEAKKLLEKYIKKL